MLACLALASIPGLHTSITGGIYGVIILAFYRDAHAAASPLLSYISDLQDQAEAALARAQAEGEAKVQAAEARLKTVEEQNNLLHTQLAASAEQADAAEGDLTDPCSSGASSCLCQSMSVRPGWCWGREPGQCELNIVAH